MPHVAGLRVYPVKALEGMAVDRADITRGGTLEHDREYALVDSSGEPINGKRTPRVHELDVTFDPERHRLTVVADGESRVFDLVADPDPAEAWFSAYFDEDVTITRDEDLGFVDRREAGPSVVSTATLETVASWFDELTVDSVRRRLRANIEIDGVPPFWEDRFVGEDAPAFRAGDVRIEGVTPCGRCVVPTRDPDTGDALEGFQERFVERREATFPDWADRDAFDHYYSLMLIARVPDGRGDTSIQVGDDVDVVEE